MLYKQPLAAWKSVTERGGEAAIFNGDCRRLLRVVPDNSVSLVVTSPPYCMGKEYEPGNSIEDFIVAHDEIFPEIERILRPGGSICWQVGYHVQKNAVVPLDYLIYDSIRKLPAPLIMRNRIIWHFGHGQHCERRFSGRHETISWFTKGDNYIFDLDPIRVPQKYPGQRASRGPRQGELSGNPLGKNPSDIWDIPNVKANHVEKTAHPCQFPVALIRRLILSLTAPGELVLDPFTGSGSAGVAAVLEGRRFVGSEIREDYSAIASERFSEALDGSAKVRPDESVKPPSEGSSVARKPDHFWPNITA